MLRLVVVATSACATLAGAALVLAWRRRSSPPSWSSEHRLRDGKRCTVRRAAVSDIAAVYALIYDLAVVCGEGHELQVDIRSITAAFQRGSFEALVAVIDGSVIGMAIVQESFRTFTGNSLYLQDLIVAEAWRGAGLGSLLFHEVAAFALRRQCNRLFWESVADNHRANAFYAEAIGAEQVTCHLNWRIEGCAQLEVCARQRLQ
jgi:GNAT superfamily N-acetyltransferase